MLHTWLTQYCKLCSFLATPAMSAIWPQTMRIHVSKLETETKERLLTQNIQHVFCNKGL